MLYSLILLLSINGSTDYYTVDYNLSFQDCVQYLEGRNSNEAQCVLQTEILNTSTRQAAKQTVNR